jgi:hypothetical protein
MLYFFRQYCISPVHQSEWCKICRPTDYHVMAPYCSWHDLRPFVFPLALKYFLYCLEYHGVGPLHSSVGLRVVYKLKCDLRSHLLTKVLEHYTIKVLCIVDCDVPRNTIAANDILPEELFDGCGAYVCEMLCLNSLHEVFDCHNSEGVIALCWG